MKMWRKFYECECMSEGIMISLDQEDNTVYLAFFQHGINSIRQLSFKEKLRWCKNILINGIPFLDQVILNKTTAKELGQDLINFSNEKNNEKTL